MFHFIYKFFLMRPNKFEIKPEHPTKEKKTKVYSVKKKKDYD